ncbi:hypothetical protein ABKN59_011035 [Abortiporus biennis]
MAGDHKCPVCNSTFTRPQHVARHMRSHTGDRPYKCQHCGDQFARSDLLSRHVNKCHASERPPTTTAPSNRRKGPTAASRATTSKQACDQCVQSSLPCDGSNPCTKCVQRKCRCTYVKFHRQTAPAGPGHPPPNAVPPHHPNDFVLAPPPGTTNLSAIYGMSSHQTAPVDYTTAGYHPSLYSNARESPTPSLTTTSSTRDGSIVDGNSPDMMARYRAQAELLRTTNITMLPPSSSILAPPQSVLSGIYDHNPQQVSDGRYGSNSMSWNQSFQSFVVASSSSSATSLHHVLPATSHLSSSTHGGPATLHEQSHSTHAHEQQRQHDTFSTLPPPISFPWAGDRRNSLNAASSDYSDGSQPSSANSSTVHLPALNGPSRKTFGFDSEGRPSTSGGVGEGGFSSTFGLMSLDDPNVLAGLAGDGAPFFSTISADSRNSPASTGDDVSSKSASDFSVDDHSRNGSTTSLDSSMSSSKDDALFSFPTSGPLSANSREELKEFWKQYMRTPLTGPGGPSPLFGPSSGLGLVTPTNSGNHFQLGATGDRPSPPSRRHSRVASFPSMKTPTIAMSEFGGMFGSSFGGQTPTLANTANYNPPTISGYPPITTFQLNMNALGSKKKSQSHQHMDDRSQQQQGKTTIHGTEDLKSYEQAVLARRGLTELKIVPRRRGTVAAPPSATAPKMTTSLSSPSPSSKPGMGIMADGASKISELLNRPSTGTASGSLADAFGRSGSPGSSASPPSFSEQGDSPTPDTHGGMAPETRGVQGGPQSSCPIDPQQQHQYSSTAALSSDRSPNLLSGYRPSFKRLASQTLGPDNAKRALLGPAGWEESNPADEDEDEDPSDDDSVEVHSRFGVPHEQLWKGGTSETPPYSGQSPGFSMRRMSAPSATMGSAHVVLPPMKIREGVSTSNFDSPMATSSPYNS